ncbi:MAG: nitroreductase [Verrucomicrobiales bacterium]|nr:nitroreductase [Verrucomicrobiales bacterium]
MSDESDTPPLDPLSLRLAAANALIRRRRTIKPKDMSEKPIESAHLAAILENGNWAPTHGMTEPWRFFVFTGEGRQRLADFCQSLYKKITPEDAVRPDKYEKLGKQPLMSPVVVAIGMKRQEIEKIPEIEEIEAVACAVQNMHLTASALGMAAFWSSPPISYTDEMREWLGMEDPRDKCLGFFYLGWPASDEWPESSRGDITDKVSMISG